MKTESFVTLDRWHQDFNRLVKVATICFAQEAHLFSGPEAPSRIENLVKQFPSPLWSEQSFEKPDEIFRKAESLLSTILVFHAFVRFEVFVSELLTELLQFSRSISFIDRLRPKKPKGFPAKADRADQCSWLARDYLRKGLSQVLEEMALAGLRDKCPPYIVVLANYFRLSRNCLAHSGFASKALTDQYSVAKIAFHDWHGKRKAPKLPQPDFALPTPLAGSRLEFAPHHALFASAVLRQQAKSLSENAAARLGREGLTKMAAWNSLLIARHDARPLTSRGASYVVNHFLNMRYECKNVHFQETEGRLSRLGLLKTCKIRWKEIYPPA